MNETEGRISKRDYTDKDGIKRYFTDIISERLIPLDAGGDASLSSGSGDESSVSEPSVETDENSDLPF